MPMQTPDLPWGAVTRQAGGAAQMNTCTGWTSKGMSVRVAAARAS